MLEVMRPRQERSDVATAISYFSVLGLAIVFNVWMTAPFILTVLMGGILAMLASPVYRKLRRRGLRPVWAAVTVTLGVTVLIIGPLVGLGLVAANQAIKVGQYLADSQTFSIEYMTGRLAEWGPAREFITDPLALEQQIRSGIQGAGKGASSAALNLLGGAPRHGLQIALAILTFFFLLMDGKKLVTWLDSRVPLAADVKIRLYTAFRNTAVSVVLATLAAALAQAALMFLTFVVLGVPMAVLAGGATFLFAWIPVIGSAPVWIAGAIYLYSQGSSAAMVVMIAMGVVTSIVDNFVRPLVLRGRSNMHPLVSLVAIFGAVQTFGIVGVLVGPILAAVLLALLQVFPAVGQKVGLAPTGPVSVAPAQPDPNPVGSRDAV